MVLRQYVSLGRLSNICFEKKSRNFQYLAASFLSFKLTQILQILNIKSSLFIISDNVPVGGLCSIHEQCTGSHHSGICGHGRCTCVEGFIFFDLACMKSNVKQFKKNMFLSQKLLFMLVFKIQIKNYIQTLLKLSLGRLHHYRLKE